METDSTNSNDIDTYNSSSPHYAIGSAADQLHAVGEERETEERGRMPRKRAEETDGKKERNKKQIWKRELKNSILLLTMLNL